MQSYHTFLVADVRTADQISALDNPHSWRFLTHPDPSKKHWSSSDGRHRMISYEDLERTPRIPDMQPSLELLLEAEDEETAENVASLVYAGVLLGYPDRSKNPEPASPAPRSALTRHDLSRDQLFRSWFQYYEPLLVGCRTAIEAWGTLSLTYAAEKFRFSLELDSFTPHSGSPRFGQVFATSYPDHSYHVRAAFAIIAAFSVVEELGLEVRSSQQKPRFVGEGKNEWNPDVWEDLKSRMARAGMPADEEVQWLFRGDPTAIERKMKPLLGTQIEGWGEDVRDRSMRLGEAVHQVSWLRNFIAAHKFGEVVSELGPYDVHNSQLVARRTLLGSLGLWDWLLATVQGKAGHAR